MDSNTDKSNKTLDTIVAWATAILLTVSLVLFALLAFISLNASYNTVLYARTAFDIVAIIAVFAVHQWMKRRIQEHLAGLADSQTKSCPSCSKLLRKDEKFCSSCGQSVVNNTPSLSLQAVQSYSPTLISATRQLRCPSCGATRTIQDAFCGVCGAPVS